MATIRPISRSPTVLSLVFICIVFGGYVFPAVEAIWLTVPSDSGTKCVWEEIQSGAVVVADFFCIDQQEGQLGPTIDVRVISPFGNEIYNVKNVSQGEFVFTPTESGAYSACFSLDREKQKSPVVLNLDWKIGIRAKDWDSIAKKEKLEGVEVLLRRQKGEVEEIMRNLLYIRAREVMMRRLNEATNRRVSQLSIMSMLLCILVSAAQACHLKRFFHKNKLI